MLMLPLQRSENAHRRPTALLFLHRRNFAKPPPSSSLPPLGMRSTRKEESRAWFRRFQLLSRIIRNSSRNARRHKLPRPGAMAMANLEEIFLNGPLRQSRLWESRQRLEEATPKARALCTLIRRFGHHARACNTGRNKPWEGAPTSNPSNYGGEKGKKPGGAGAPLPGNAQAGKQLRAQNARRSQEHTGINQKQTEAGKQAGHPAHPNIHISSDALPSARAAQKSTKGISECSEIDQAMADPTTPLGPRQGKLSPTARTRPENPLLEQPNFGYRPETPHQTYLSVANANPFAALETIILEKEDLKHTQEETSERWVFQASRKQAPRFASPGKAPPLSQTCTPTQDCASGSKRKRTRSEWHQRSEKKEPPLEGPRIHNEHE
ncbi:unnamed protein product [Sphagnum troendelagicum]